MVGWSGQLSSAFILSKIRWRSLFLQKLPVSVLRSLTKSSTAIYFLLKNLLKKEFLLTRVLKFHCLSSCVCQKSLDWRQLSATEWIVNFYSLKEKKGSFSISLIELNSCQISLRVSSAPFCNSYCLSRFALEGVCDSTNQFLEFLRISSRLTCFASV